MSVPYILCSNLFPVGLHVYSSKNRADAPSRDREVEKTLSTFTALV